MADQYDSILWKKNSPITRIEASVSTSAPIAKITLVKNCGDYMFVRKPEWMIFDYHQVNACDSYYLRVEPADGRLGWTSPIRVHQRQ